MSASSWNVIEKIAFSRRRPRASSRRWHFPEDDRALLREDDVFSKTVARFFEKMAFLEDGRALLREDGVFSKTAARFFEKMTFSRRWPRASLRRWRLPEDDCVLLRDDGVFSKMIQSFIPVRRLIHAF